VMLPQALLACRSTPCAGTLAVVAPAGRLTVSRIGDAAPQWLDRCLHAAPFIPAVQQQRQHRARFLFFPLVLRCSRSSSPPGSGARVLFAAGGACVQRHRAAAAGGELAAWATALAGIPLLTHNYSKSAEIRIIFLQWDVASGASRAGAHHALARWQILSRRRDVAPPLVGRGPSPGAPPPLQQQRQHRSRWFVLFSAVLRGCARLLSPLQ